MPPLRAVPVLVLTVLTVASCADEPTSPDAALAPDAAFARGGNGKGNKGGNAPEEGLEALGKLLFEDANLSLNGNQSCQSCHHPDQGFAAPDESGVQTQGSVVEGSIAGQFGDRKPPTAAYATLAPNFEVSGNGATGGNFWDGRATGNALGNPAADQARGPFVNPAEQAMLDEACVVYRVWTGTYRQAFFDAWEYTGTEIAWPGSPESYCGPGEEPIGPALSAEDQADAALAYDRIAIAIASFEATLNTFSSPFDQGTLSASGRRGEKLFGSSGKCQQCHDNKGGQPLFTDFQYHNLGVPPNPFNPMRAADPTWVDVGLARTTSDPTHAGRFKTPTVRNVAEGDRRTYMHNGVLVDLIQVVDFYNTRDVLPVCDDPSLHPAEYGSYDRTYQGEDYTAAGCWPAPEIGANLDTKNMGNLGLSDAEVMDIAQFMAELTDADAP